MAEKDKQSQDQRTDRPETKPYAPPRHPDVHVPEQQFEGDADKGNKPDKQGGDHPTG